MPVASQSCVSPRELHLACESHTTISEPHSKEWSVHMQLMYGSQQDTDLNTSPWSTESFFFIAEYWLLRIYKFSYFKNLASKGSRPYCMSLYWLNVNTQRTNQESQVYKGQWARIRRLRLSNKPAGVSTLYTQWLFTGCEDGVVIVVVTTNSATALLESKSRPSGEACTATAKSWVWAPEATMRDSRCSWLGLD